MSSFHRLLCSSLRGNIHTEIFRFLTTRLAETGPSSQPVLLRHQERALLVPTLKPAGKLFLKLGKQAVLPQPGNGFPFPCSTHKVSRRHRGKSFPLLPPRLRGRLTRPHPALTTAPPIHSSKFYGSFLRKIPRRMPSALCQGDFSPQPPAPQPGCESFASPGPTRAMSTCVATDQRHVPGTPGSQTPPEGREKV